MKNSGLSLSKAHKQKLAHFANIIKLARVDFVINGDEQELLDRLAKQLGIEKQEYKNVLENPDAYPINPPVTYDERIERLYNLTNMIFIDGEIIGDEVDLLQRIAIDLGFPTDIIEKISDKAIHLIINNYNLDEFKSAIKGIYTI